MTTTDARVMQLLEAILDSGMSPEQACADAPELLAPVRVRLANLRAFEGELDGILPDSTASRRLSHIPDLQARTPDIPGYHIDAVVGSGGMGVVYRARHLKLNRIVAIKMLLSGVYATPADLERFKQEAQAVAALCHPNIVQVFDAGECDGHPYFVMEFMDGGSLAYELDGIPQPSPWTAATTATMARAVQAAHNHGIVHRDLKPGNLLLTADGTLKIADFGLARRAASELTERSLFAARMGTPSYMSPEQTLGRPTAYEPSVDIYSLGAVLYEMLTGRPPFRGDTSAETQRQVLSEDPVPPARLAHNTPRDLETICLKCLQKDPAKRYATARELADDLDRFARGEPVRARRTGAVERAIKLVKRRPAASALLATLALAIVAGIIGAMWLNRLEQAQATENTIREGVARSAVESAISVAERLRSDQRWPEAQGLLDTAASRLPDAHSPTLDATLAKASANLRLARELDRIRENYPEAGDFGYNFHPALVAYLKVFDEIGAGESVPVPQAARAIVRADLRFELLIALDNAAFVAWAEGTAGYPERFLEVARIADPHPLRDRFRDIAAWKDRGTLLAVINDERQAPGDLAEHQVVIAGVLLAGLGANDQTIAILRDTQAKNPTDFWVNHELANALFRGGRSAEACEFHRAALAIHPNNSTVWTSLGLELSASSNVPQAITAYRRAIAINPTYATPHDNLIRLLTQTGELAQAADAIEIAARAIPSRAADFHRLLSDANFARVDSAQSRWSQAAARYNAAVDGQARDDSEVWFETAATRLLAGDAPGYRAACEHMLAAASPPLRPFLIARACTLGQLDSKMLAQATGLARLEFDISPQSHWALTEQAALLCRQGSPAQAVPLLMQSSIANPNTGTNVLNWLWLGIAYRELGDQEEASRWTSQAGQWLASLGPRIPPDADRLSLHLHNWLEAKILLRELTGATPIK